MNNKSILIKRDSARNSIKRCLVSSKKAESLDEAELHSHLAILAEHWHKFKDAQEGVELSCGDETREEQESEREQGECWYREAFANLTRAKNKLVPTNYKTDVSKTRADIKLPRMDLPHFAGDPKEWRSFRDAFTSFIHSESSMSGSQKLHYLRCSLDGEALQVVKGFPITDENYQEAWTLLMKRYNNERVIVDAHFRALFSLSKVTEESSRSIKSLLDQTQEHFQSLKALGRPVENWDDWLMHLTVSKLDPDTHRQWELSQKEDKVATFGALAIFLETRCRSLDAVDCHRQPISNLRSAKGKGKFSSGSLHSTVSNQQLNQRTSKGGCCYCSANHRIYSCDKFRSLDVASRISFANGKHLCNNCLSLGHDQRNCRSTSACQVCKIRHHTLLHREEPDVTGIVSSTGLTPSYFVHAQHHVLLGTAAVKIVDQSGRYQPARLLFDNGSHLTFISEACLQRLKLRRTPACTAIEGIGATAAGNSTGVETLLYAP